jgi:hypothetical protein
MIILLKTTLFKPDGCRKVGRPKLRWRNGIEDGDIGRWTRGNKKNVLEAARTHWAAEPLPVI